MQRRGFLALAAAALPARYLPGAAAPLYLLTYDHGGLVLWGLDHFAAKLREAMSWLERYPKFKLGLDNEAYTYDYLARHRPAMLQEIRDGLARFSGRFGIGACTYGQPLSCFINEESNIRQIAYAIEADQRYFGRRPPVYLMSEHALHAQLPQILASFNFHGAILRTHYMMYGYNPTFDAAIGWWIGLDGSRVPAIPTYPDEGAAFGKTTVDNWILTRCPGPDCRGSLTEFRARFAHIRPLLATRADDSGLRREDLVRQSQTNPQDHWLLLEDLAAVFPAPKIEFPTAANDFVTRMPWGYCGNIIWNQSRAAEVAVLTAERLAALELLAGGRNREADLDDAWKKLLVGQHHDVQICGLLPEARRFLGDSLAASARVRQGSLAYLAARLRAAGPAQVTVFNPHSWRAPQWVEATVVLPRDAAAALRVTSGGKAVPAVLVDALRGADERIQEARIAFRADAPPLGAAAYTVVPVDAAPAPPESIDIDGLHITTTDWEIILAPGGGLSVRRRGGEVLLRRTLFAGRIDGVDRESSGRWRLLPRPAGAPWVTAREDGTIGAIPYRLEITAWAGSPRLDCRAEFEFEGQKIGELSDNRRDAHAPFVHERKLRLKLFAAGGAAAVGIRDLPFAVAETPDRYIQGNYWTACSDGRSGVAVFNRGAMALVREDDGGFSVPLAYSMYYIWGTRLLSGKFAYEFALWPFSGPWREADLHRRALEYNFPAAVLAGGPGDGRLGEHFAPLAVESDGVLLSALYSRAGRIYARMYEHTGAAGQLRLRGPGPLTEVNLLGAPVSPAPSPLRFRPWQIRTVRL